MPKAASMKIFKGGKKEIMLGARENLLHMIETSNESGIESAVEDWIEGGSLFEEIVNAVTETTGTPDDLHPDVEAPTFADSHNLDNARDAAIEAVCDAVNDDIENMVTDYLNKFRDEFIADAVQDAVQNEYDQWQDDVTDESDELKENDDDDDDDDTEEDTEEEETE